MTTSSKALINASILNVFPLHTQAQQGLNRVVYK
jgi:hypothetical protein